MKTKKLPLRVLAFSLGLGALHGQAQGPSSPQELASIGTAVNVTLEGQNQAAFARTSFDTLGKLFIVVEFKSDEEEKTRNDLVIESKISPANFQTFRQDVVALNGAKILTRLTGHCDNMPPWNQRKQTGLEVRDGLTETSNFSALEMREITNPPGCWVGRITAPADPRLNQIAVSLAESLAVLRNEALADLK